MKKLVKTAEVLVIVSMGGVYYLGVLPEYQLFKFLALAALVALYGMLRRNEEDSE